MNDITEFPQGAFITVEMDFIVKSPSSLSTPNKPDIPVEYFQSANEFLNQRKILTATDWAKSSNSKLFRPATHEDFEVIERSFLSVVEHARRELESTNELVVVFASLESIRFGCVSGRIQLLCVAMAAIGTMLAGASAAKETFFERPNLSYNCSAQISRPEEVKHHASLVLRHNPQAFFDSKNKDCVRIRQYLLKHEGYLGSNVDGLYGDKTIRAEMQAAKTLRTGSSDIQKLYKTMVESTR